MKFFRERKVVPVSCVFYACHPQFTTDFRHVPLISRSYFVLFHKGGHCLAKTIEQKSEDISYKTEEFYIDFLNRDSYTY